MLPIVEIYPRLVTTLKTNPLTLLQAPPGAGKSTWLPLQLVRDGHFKRIIMLEPRRLAARNIAHYLAKLQNENLGQSIGLRVRQEKYISNNTRLEIVTEGTLTRMLQHDPELSGTDCIIFDEFHERSLALDTALAFALESQEAFRPDLTLLLMSATLDADKIVGKLACPVITSQGRSFPIDEIYHPVKNEKRWLDEIPNLIKRAMNEQTGNCLVFLPGQREINVVWQALKNVGNNISVFPLYGSQSKETQQKAISPAALGLRKIVLSTNVAETSITIEGIRIVVDSEKKRAACFNLNTGVTELQTVAISQSSAVQRAGRAGRTEPGVVYRLGSKESFKRREPHDVPDILASDISQFLLETKYWGAELDALTLLDYPSAAQQQQTNDLLLMLEAVNEQNKITHLGTKMLNFGTNLRWAYMLIKAKELEPCFSGITILSVYLLALFDSNVSLEPDINIALQHQLQSPHPVFAKQLKFWLSRMKHKAVADLNDSNISLLVALAYPDRLAKRHNDHYILSNGAQVDFREGYWLNDEFIAIAALGGQQGKRIFSGSPINIYRLKEVLPHLFKQKKVCEFSEKTGRFVFEHRLMLNALIVDREAINEPIDEDIRTNAWLRHIRKKGFALFYCFTTNLSEKKTNDISQLLIRMTLAHRLFSDEFPELDETRLLARLEHWLAPYLKGVKNLEQLKRIDLFEPLKNCFDWHAQSKLHQLFPKFLTVPSGSQVTISYQLDGPAMLSVRMQEVYGLTTTPVLAKGKLPLLMDLLSPARRSLQLTQDIAGFWQGSYRSIQKEMKGRYPKHFWPNNPAQATATSKTKAKM